MNYLQYNENITKEELLKYNIVISDTAKISAGVKLSFGVCILGDSIIEDNCEISGNTVIDNSTISRGVKILSSMVTDSRINEGSTVGPFANIRNETVIGKNCRIGNFVEIKKSVVGDQSKIAHLTYVGDAEIGNDCNIGCGVVFCNYNGEIKQKSHLGNGVFVGSNVNIIAPVTIGDNAYIAAGSTINKDIENDEFAIARERQINKKNFNNPYKNHQNS